MSDTNIEWATKVWNVTRGCRRVSPGCGGPHNQGGCYAERQAIRQAGPGGAYEGLVENTGKGPRWTGKGRFAADKLEEPMHWRKPQGGSRHRVFVNSMSDLFFEEFSNEQIAAVFGVMAACPDHDFLVLTKRAERMREWFAWIGLDARRARERCAQEALTLLGPDSRCLRAVGVMGMPMIDGAPRDWPLRNCWLGVSAEDQQRAEERIPHLLATPAAVRFVSAEPLLGPVDLNRIQIPDEREGLHFSALKEQHDDCFGSSDTTLDWLICGGESGPGSRRCDVAWLRSIIEQCKAADVPVFCKQLGANVRDRNDAGFDGQDGDAWNLSQRLLDRRVIEHDPDGIRNEYQGAPVRIRLVDRKGGNMAEWPEDLRVREFPKARP